MTVPENPVKQARRAADLRQRLAMVACLGLVAVALGASLGLMGGIDKQIADMTRTYEGRNQARELSLALTNAEGAQFDYVLTGEARFRDLFASALGQIEKHGTSLSGVVERSPTQADQVSAIVEDIGQRTDSLARSVELMTAQRTAEALALIDTTRVDRPMDGARVALEQFIGVENQKLLERNDSIDWTRRWLVGATIIALVGAVMLAFLLFWRAQREVRALALNRSELQSENEALEAKVAERTQAVEEARSHAEQERQRVETLLQDTNHRIGNSLATVSSLLALQLLRSTSDEVRHALEAARSRVHAIASAHRRLRLGDDLETISADQFLDAVLQDLASSVTSTKGVQLVGKIEPIEIKARDATTIGILVGELVTNALKHAFPEERGGYITVELKRDASGMPTLSVTDDGVGIESATQAGEGGLGSVIIKQLARQFGGVPEYQPGDENGLRVIVPLPGIGIVLDPS